MSGDAVPDAGGRQQPERMRWQPMAAAALIAGTWPVPAALVVAIMYTVFVLSPAITGDDSAARAGQVFVLIVTLGGLFGLWWLAWRLLRRVRAHSPALVAGVAIVVPVVTVFALPSIGMLSTWQYAVVLVGVAVVSAAAAAAVTEWSAYRAAAVDGQWS
ncbi:hypothetical protein [Haloechinothrix sp. LS1_15]|uniref:hypothetical protein n=1 Tax=Haloechinothrix sp. LS1_15 TaxID=2652248 RepID=UPI0029461AC4|nr:hypothetical protein [Haloechinothrix sp. LS1_15]MDV6012555.1 hypothetical protein [Haloechinothrix sp. LS1_15]